MTPTALSRIAVLVLSLLVSGQTAAADWQIVRRPTATGGGGFLQLDRASILRKGDVVSVWTRAVYENAFDIPDAPPLRARVVASLTDYNCKERTETTRKVIYLSDDESMMNMAEKGPFDTADIIPDTSKDRIFAIVCRKKK